MDETPTPAEQPTSRRRTALILLVTAVVVAAAAVGGWIWIDHATSGPQARSGQFLSDSSPRITDPAEATVRVPWGTLTITTGRPSERITSSALYSPRFKARFDEIEAPDDGRWLAVDIEPDVSIDGDLIRSRPDAGIPATTVSLVSGGHVLPVARSAGRTNLTGTGADLGSLFVGDVGGYLALPDSGEDLRVRVDFGGVRQQVEVDGSHPDHGAAAPLYRTQAAFRTTNCSKGTVAGYRVGYVVTGACEMKRLEVMPYVAGLGWAEPGRRWLITTVRTLPPAELFRVGRSTAAGRYFAERGDEAHETTTMRYGHTAAVTTVPYNEVETQFAADPDDPTLFVFDVAAGDTGRSATFTLTTRFVALPSNDGVDGSASAGVQLTATRTIDARD